MIDALFVIQKSRKKFMSASDRGRPIGYVMESCYCLKCAPEGLIDSYPPTEYENDKTYGSAYRCDVCNKKLYPLDEDDQ